MDNASVDILPSHVALLVPSVRKAADYLSRFDFQIGPEEIWDGEGTKEIYIEQDKANSLLLMEPIKPGDNLYVVPLLLGETPKPYPFRHFGNWSELAYIQEGPTELFTLWNDDERKWVRDQWNEPALQEDIRNYVSVQIEMDKTTDREARGTLMKKSEQIAAGRRLRAI